jgi:signal-transduction protein with cAMP-binding, CBS, and nucleotidyltransferase domain
MKIDQLVIREPVTITPDATIQRAAQRMADHGVGCLVVADGEQIVGIVTDRDLVIRAVARRVPLDGRVDAVMTTDVVTVDSDADIRDVTRAFGQHAVRRLPVTTDGRVTGLVSLDDLLTSFVGQFTELTNGLTAQLLFPHGHDEPPVPVAPAASAENEESR